MNETVQGHSLPIPHPVGIRITALVFTGFVVFFVLLAIYNLLTWTAVIPSTLWLGFVLLVLFAGSKERGVRHVFTEILGEFARQHFVRTCDEGEKTLQFGYNIFGRQFLYLKIPIDKIESVRWSSGQATAMAGRDMNDWHLSLWYDHCDPLRSQKKAKLAKTRPRKLHRRPKWEKGGYRTIWSYLLELPPGIRRCFSRGRG